MIPAPILAEAREAFWTADNTRAALEAAIAVLSRHWPAADGREALQQIASGVTHAPDDVVAIVRAALATSAPSDARLREAVQLFQSFNCPICNGDCASSNPPMLVCPMQIAKTALSTPAPAESVRIVRIMVAVDAKNDKLRTTDVFDGDDEEAWDHLASLGYPIRLCIAEIPVPIREVPVVQASVTEAGNG